MICRQSMIYFPYYVCQMLAIFLWSIFTIQCNITHCEFFFVTSSKQNNFISSAFQFSDIIICKFHLPTTVLISTQKNCFFFLITVYIFLFLLSPTAMTKCNVKVLCYVCNCLLTYNLIQSFSFRKLQLSAMS